MTQAKPSKSARKREQLDLQELGEKLIALTDAELDAMSLQENLLTAVRGAAQMKSHGALRRQKQLIGKLMRHTDAAPIRKGLEAIGTSERQSGRFSDTFTLFLLDDCRNNAGDAASGDFAPQAALQLNNRVRIRR